MSLYPLRNPVQEYKWGSRTALAELLGTPCPSPGPQAELWMGAHPRASSSVWCDGRWGSLRERIREQPEAWLGAPLAARFGGELPFLFKVLAAVRPLSLQVHPDAESARAGFERESAAGVPLDSPLRSYPDPFAKPELLCALTPFRALCGFLPWAEQQALCARLELPELDAALAAPGAAAHEAPGLSLAALLRLAPERRSAIAAAVAQRAAALASTDLAYAWVAELARFHPGDVGILAPLLLTRVELAPGQAVFLAPGRLHSYLGGTALEIMACSDNVLRSGLTPKRVDPEELLAAMNPAAGGVVRLDASRLGEGEFGFETATEAFRLSVLELASARPLDRVPRGPEILLCVEGSARARGVGEPAERALMRGQALFVAASSRGYRLNGEGRVYRACVGAAEAEGR